MGYERRKVEGKLREEEKRKRFGELRGVYKSEYEGEEIEDGIERFFECGLLSLGKNRVSVGYSVNGVSKLKFIGILERLEMKENFGRKKRRKGLYKVNVRKDLKNMMLRGYNVIEVKEYRWVGNKGG